MSRRPACVDRTARALVALCGVLLLLAPSSAQGQPTVTLTFQDPSLVHEEAVIAYTGSDARVLRGHMDANHDGQISAAEADAFRAQARHAYDNSTAGAEFAIDGVGADIRATDVPVLDGSVGAADSDALLVLHVVRTITFAIPAANGSLAHTLTMPADAGSRRTALVVVLAPPGYHIGAVAGFDANATVASDGSRLTFVDGHGHGAEKVEFAPGGLARASPALTPAVTMLAAVLLVRLRLRRAA